MIILKELLEKFRNNKDKIDQFFNNNLSDPLFYNSVDLRHSGFKIAPVDVNCFPAGANNLSLSSRQIAKNCVNEFLDSNFPVATKIAIIPENHTRNLKYLENVLTLKEILENGDKREVKIISLIDEIDNSLIIDLENNQQITLEKLARNEDNLTTANGFHPDLIISNNDFTDGVPEILKNTHQKIIPSLNLAWSGRKKSDHFRIYNQITEEFCQEIGLDPWLISTFYDCCENINFKEKKGIDEVAEKVDKLLDKIREKYQKYGIDSEAYCYVKADNGTYGMGIMTVKSGAEILAINKKERNKMNVIKGNTKNSSVIIQEGVPTTDLVQNSIAEPLIYLTCGKVVGNLFRANNSRNTNISLNAAGMSFYDLNNLNQDEINLGLGRHDICEIYDVISRLSALAASREV
ncbi:MAG: glutamate--cysteine ligase [Lentimonas sp.]|jgi:glutamate--cysteine ligase